MRITIKDCDVETFRAGGPGGQNQNKRNTGVRIRHRASGAVGESREARGQLENKRRAFRRMGESQTFRNWVAAHYAVEVPPPSSSPERIRTYQMVDRRVTDHRTKRSSSRIDEILDGNLDLIR